MDGRFGLMEIAEQIRSTGEQLTAPFNDPVGYSGPTPASMALAEELGSTLFCALSQISQDELDIFYGRCAQDHDHQRPITHEATTSALVLPKEEEREEAAEKEEEEEKTSGEAAAVKDQDEEEDEEEEVIMYKVDQKLHEQLMRKHYYPKYSMKSCRSLRKRSSK